MAVAQIQFFSQALSRITTFHMVMPNDAPQMWTTENPNFERLAKTLVLLHGFNGTSTDWLYGGAAQDLAIKYNLYIILPAGENSFYLNGKGSGRAYQKYVGEELVHYVQNMFHLSTKKEDTFIGGFSMGGYGAIHTALAYPNTFGKVVGLSNAFIIHQLKEMKPEDENPMANYDYYVDTFGDLSLAEKSDINPENQVLKLLKNHIEMPALYMACGTEDFLLEKNREFHEFLKAQEVPVDYHEGPGMHNWEFWVPWMDSAVKWLVEG